MASLDSVEVGDKLAISYLEGDSYRIEKVVRITKTLVITDKDRRFKKSTGFSSDGGYSRLFANIATEEHYKLIAVSDAKATLETFLFDCDEKEVGDLLLELEQVVLKHFESKKEVG